MKFLKLIPILLIFFGLFPYPKYVLANDEDPKNYKVLSLDNKKLSVTNVEILLKEGDSFIKNGDLDKAKDSYDKARDLAKQLAGFYNDLNGVFRGLDARVPIEMENKGRKSIKAWAESNARLAALYIRKEQPEVAVPLLVEIIRLMTPASDQGKNAYKSLIQLGFVETSFGG